MTLKNIKNLPCPVCKNKEGYIQQRKYLKEFFYPCCFFSYLMKNYRNQFKENDKNLTK